MSPCPDVEDIAVLAEGKLKGEPREQLIEHLSGCETCYQIFAQTLDTLQTISRNRRKRFLWFSVPPMALAAAIALFFKITLFSPQYDPLSVTMLNGLAGVIEPGRLNTGVVGHRGIESESFNDLTGAFQTGLIMAHLMICVEGNSLRAASSALNHLKVGFHKDTAILARISRVETVLDQPDRAHEWKKTFTSLAAEIEGRFSNRDLFVYQFGEWCEVSRAVLLSKSPEAIAHHFNGKRQYRLIFDLSGDARLPRNVRDRLQQITAILSQEKPIYDRWFELKTGVDAVIQAMKSHNPA